MGFQGLEQKEQSYTQDDPTQVGFYLRWGDFHVCKMEEWTIYKEFRFEAAHRLPNYDGKCSRLHGHSWIGRIYVRGNHLIESGPKQGMIVDFSDLKAYIQPLLDNYLDHYYLNETTGLENPTSEALAQWIYRKLAQAGLPGLYAVEIRETCTSGCKYTNISH